MIHFKKLFVFNGKKGAEGIEYVILILGALVFVSSMLMYSINISLKQEQNPFFSQPGEREYYLLSLYQAVYAELFSVDLFAKYALSETISDVAMRFGNEKSSSCGSYLTYPIVNGEQGFCEPDGMKISVERSFEDAFYSHVLASDVDFPFRYDYSAIIDAKTNEFKLLGLSLDTIKYSLNPHDILAKKGATFQNKQFDFDLSTSCHYIADNMKLAYSDGKLREGFECTDSYCTGPCPSGLDIRAVPYFNQCHISACESRSCRIDQDEICKVGCMFKSLQMAYAFYGSYFDETQSIHTNKVEDLLVELYHTTPSSIQRKPNSATDALLRGKTIINNNEKYGEKKILERVDASHYTQLENMVSEGLVVIRFRKVNGCPVPDELGSCPDQHFVVVLAANDDFVVIHDPWTPGRPYESGMNVVLSRDFIKQFWTGRYVEIT